MLEIARGNYSHSITNARSVSRALRSCSHKHKYFIFSLKQTGTEGNKTTWGWEINAKSEHVPDDKNLEAFTEVVKQLPADEARFVVFDFTETKSDGRMIKKLLLIKWCVFPFVASPSTRWAGSCATRRCGLSCRGAGRCVPQGVHSLMM